MPYDTDVDRTDAGALIPEEVSQQIIGNVPGNSAVMSLATKLPNMSRKQRRMPVLSSMASAYFIDGDKGLLQTSEATWEDKYIEAERLGVIIPIPKTVLSDTAYDMWGQLRPQIEAAIGKAFDQAVFYSTNKPTSWPAGIVPGAVAAGHGIVLGSVGSDLYDDIMADGGVLSKVEEDGFYVGGHIGALGLKARLRGLRDDMGMPIFTNTVQGKNAYALDGETIIFPDNGSILPATSLLISGDFKQIVYAMRADLTYEILKETVLQDAAGNITFNLAQQEMIALKVVMRLGWQLPNPINVTNANPATRYPFAVLQPTP